MDLKSNREINVDTGTHHYIVLCFTAFYRYCFFYELKLSGNPASSNYLGTIPPIARAPFKSVSHFGNYHNISSIFIITVFVMVSSEQ